MRFNSANVMLKKFINESEDTMKKLFPLIVGCVLSLSALNAHAGKNCDTYFSEMNNLIKLAEQENKGAPEMKAQIDAMKAQLTDAKKALASYPEAEQENACGQAVEAIKQAKASGDLG